MECAPHGCASQAGVLGTQGYAGVPKGTLMHGGEGRRGVVQYVVASAKLLKPDNFVKVVCVLCWRLLFAFRPVLSGFFRFSADAQTIVKVFESSEVTAVSNVR